TLDELIGRVDLLDVDAAVGHWKTQGLDLSNILAVSANPADSALRQMVSQNHGLDEALDRQKLIPAAEPALVKGEKVTISSPIRNVNRTVGTMLGHEVVKRQGLPPGTIEVDLQGSAGQSFGAFLPTGIDLYLTGDANDYLGKGLSGGRIIVRPAPDATFAAEDNMIAGNVIGYGATSGQIFLSGLVGERFAVRNSGAHMVVEGVGDHALEYMTGGVVVILGRTGRNLAAGMSGGTAYVLDLKPHKLTDGALASGALLTDTLDELEARGDKDSEMVIDLIQRHVAETWSRVGADLLSALEEDRTATLRRITRLVPADYARMNAALAKAKAQGRDYHEPAVWSQIYKEATRG
ncbi:MAG: glutamate synthase subunit alpha, partial [Bifidobacteriaceae bacterium]|nr:glutamate synthase subunit alpha [Bifidobacteriaceae bacterium]